MMIKISYIIFGFVIVISLAQHTSKVHSKELLEVPDVNHILGNAYYRSDGNKEASFWLGTALSRCSAAASLASKMNRGLIELFNDKRKGFFGGQPPKYWDNLAKNSKEAAVIMFEVSGQTREEAAKHFNTLLVMSESLYWEQMKLVDSNGFPNWIMFKADLDDCKAFFSQDKDDQGYRPRK